MKVVVRPAKVEDVPAILEMSGKFYPFTMYSKFADMDEESVTQLINYLIHDGILLVAVADDVIVGMVGAVLSPFLFNVHTKQASEVVWWVDPDYRELSIGKLLLKELEAVCNDRAVDIIMMLSFTHMPNAGKLYYAMGYNNTENAWLKVL